MLCTLTLPLPTATLTKVTATPDVMGWIGWRRQVFVQADVGNGPLGLGSPTARIALSSGLGAAYGRYVLAGVAPSDGPFNRPQMFVSGLLVPIGKTGLFLEPHAATDFNCRRQVTLRLQYQLKTRK